ncbi:MAG: biotin transporter BioY [Flavobacteriales bacterium]
MFAEAKWLTSPLANYLVKWITALGFISILSPFKIDIPGEVPLTLQSFAVILATMLFGWRVGVPAIVAYILLGAIGLPIFPGMKSGIDGFAVTGGFYFGFIAAGMVCGTLQESALFRKNWASILIWFIGHGVILIAGLFWLNHFTGKAWQQELKLLYPGALIKSAAGALLLDAFRRYLSPKPHEQLIRED